MYSYRVSLGCVLHVCERFVMVEFPTVQALCLYVTFLLFMNSVCLPRLLSSLWVSCTGSASDWCALGYINLLIQYNTRGTQKVLNKYILKLHCSMLVVLLSIYVALY